MKTFVMPFAFAGRSFQPPSPVPCLDHEIRESKGYAIHTLLSDLRESLKDSSQR